MIIQLAVGRWKLKDGYCMFGKIGGERVHVDECIIIPVMFR